MPHPLLITHTGSQHGSCGLFKEDVLDPPHPVRHEGEDIDLPSPQRGHDLLRRDEASSRTVHGDGERGGWLSKLVAGVRLGKAVQGYAKTRAALVEVDQSVGSHYQHTTWKKIKINVMQKD